MIFDRVFWITMLVLFLAGLASMGISMVTWGGTLGYVTAVIGGSLMGNSLGWSITGLFAMWYESR